MSATSGVNKPSRHDILLSVPTPQWSQRNYYTVLLGLKATSTTFSLASQFSEAAFSKIPDCTVHDTTLLRSLSVSWREFGTLDPKDAKPYEVGWTDPL